MHVSQNENGKSATTVADFSHLSLTMISDVQFCAARVLLDRPTALLAEALGPSEWASLCADQDDGVPGMKPNNLVELQRVVETAAMVSIDADAAIGGGVRLRQP